MKAPTEKKAQDSGRKRIGLEGARIREDASFSQAWPLLPQVPSNSVPSLYQVPSSRLDHKLKTAEAPTDVLERACSGLYHGSIEKN